MKFYIIGIDDSAKPHLSSELQELIAKKSIFSGGSRHHQIIRDSLPIDYTWIDITPPMTSLFERYAGYDEVVVFASGDPLFYGFASTLQRFNPTAEMVVYPSFNSLQTLAHRAQIAYHDMIAVSLTGRNWDRFDMAMIEGYKLLGVLTDTREHTPEKIAQRMLKYGYNNYMITVGSLLGNKEMEEVRKMSVEECAQGQFNHPCSMIMEQAERRARPFGIKDIDFMTLEGRSRMITKRPIRLALLSLLELRDADTLWDVGFCTGSVSIEAKLQFPHLKVVSFEKREECREIIKHNISKHGAIGIEYHIGDFMQCSLNDIRQPDAIFIGGHGGNLLAIVERCTHHLKEGGRLLFNSVSLQSEEMFRDAVVKCGLKIEDCTTMQIDDFNTIKIIKTVK